MTMIDQPATAPASAVSHPDWCDGRRPLASNHCDAAAVDRYPGMVQGEHVRVLDSVQSHYGPRIDLGLVAAADDGDRVAVLLSVPFDNEGCIPAGMTEQEADQLTRGQLRWLGQHVYLRPEEARMLARLLGEAADEWDRVTGRG